MYTNVLLTVLCQDYVLYLPGATFWHPPSLDVKPLEGAWPYLLNNSQHPNWQSHPKSNRLDCLLCRRDERSKETVIKQLKAVHLRLYLDLFKIIIWIFYGTNRTGELRLFHLISCKERCLDQINYIMLYTRTYLPSLKKDSDFDSLNKSRDLLIFLNVFSTSYFSPAR